MLKIFLPLIRTAPGYTQPDHAWETDMARLLTGDPRQQRKELRRDETLMQVAQARVDDMARRNCFGHVDPDGYGPNYHVRQAGFPLPSNYSTAKDANNVESIAGGYQTAEDCWKSLTSSPAHRLHLLGEHPFYVEQDRYGVGYTWNPYTMYHHYYAFLIAKMLPMTSGE